MRVKLVQFDCHLFFINTHTGLLILLIIIKGNLTLRDFTALPSRLIGLWICENCENQGGSWLTVWVHHR